MCSRRGLQRRQVFSMVWRGRECKKLFLPVLPVRRRSNVWAARTKRLPLELSRFLRQTVKSQNSWNGELTHGNVSTEVHEGSKSGGDSAAGWWGIDRGGGSGV